MQNDSHFLEYVNSDLLISILDTQLMKDSMISFMAHIMRNSSQKDNFYIKTRTCLQDTFSLFYVLKNIAANIQLDFYLPCLVDMLSDLSDADRCSLYLYDRSTDELYCKILTTGKSSLKRQLVFKRGGSAEDNPNILCRAFNTGKVQHARVHQMSAEELWERVGEYVQQVDSKTHTVTRNVIVVPLKLGRNVVGCIEVANKRGGQEFTEQDQEMLKAVGE